MKVKFKDDKVKITLSFDEMLVIKGALSFAGVAGKFIPRSTTLSAAALLFGKLEDIAYDNDEISTSVAKHIAEDDFVKAFTQEDLAKRVTLQ